VFLPQTGMALLRLLLVSLLCGMVYGGFGPCRTCVFVLERIKRGTEVLLPSVCSELFTNFPASYSDCHQVLNAISLNGNNVRYWLFEGCYKYEIYNSKEWVKPCPSHVMCSVLEDLQKNPFCSPLPMEDPFSTGKDAGGSGGAGGGAFVEVAAQVHTSEQLSSQHTTSSEQSQAAVAGTVASAGPTASSESKTTTTTSTDSKDSVQQPVAAASSKEGGGRPMNPS